jgi:hypothetical protein
MFKKIRGFPNLTDHVYDGDAYAVFWIVGWAHNRFGFRTN